MSARGSYRETARRLVGRGGEALRGARPHGPRGWAVATAKVVVVVAVLSVTLFVGGTAAAMFYGQYGLHTEKNAQAWASHELKFADNASCKECHGLQANTHDASRHERVTCESCHGPLQEHVIEPETAAKVIGPSSEVCIACHSAAVGRPAGFPQVGLDVHYKSGVCIGCHDPHSTAARRPTVVSHPLENLPACTVCHHPAGLKELPAGHEQAGDATCIGCHAADASGLQGASR